MNESILNQPTPIRIPLLLLILVAIVLNVALWKYGIIPAWREYKEDPRA